MLKNAFHLAAIKCAGRMLGCYSAGDEDGGDSELASLIGHCKSAESQPGGDTRKMGSLVAPFAGMSKAEKAAKIQEIELAAANGYPTPEKL
jgi:hypothetical protein